MAGACDSKARGRGDLNLERGARHQTKCCLAPGHPSEGPGHTETHAQRAARLRARAKQPRASPRTEPRRSIVVQCSFASVLEPAIDQGPALPLDRCGLRTCARAARARRRALRTSGEPPVAKSVVRL